MMSKPADVRYLLISGGNRQTSEVQAYLYASTTIFASYSEGMGTVHLALTFSPTGEAEYLANYQAGRLESGLMPTTVFENPDAAVDAAFKVLGVYAGREVTP